LSTQCCMTYWLSCVNPYFVVKKANTLLLIISQCSYSKPETNVERLVWKFICRPLKMTPLMHCTFQFMSSVKITDIVFIVACSCHRVLSRGWNKLYVIEHSNRTRDCSCDVTPPQVKNIKTSKIAWKTFKINRFLFQARALFLIKSGVSRHYNCCYIFLPGLKSFTRCNF